MMRNLKTMILMVALLLFATGCHDYFEGISKDVALEQSRKGKNNVTTSEDEDSDRPGWAGGNTDENPHIKGNDDSGTTRGGDYGDLYKLLRDDNGVPVMRQLDNLEWYVQPVDVNGETLELDAEGELVDPTRAIEVDFGRLNIVRSPQSVLDQAFEEAMKVLTAADAVITLDFCGRLTSTYTDDATGETIVKTIDSPRENMALYQHIMKYMFTDRLGFLGDLGFKPLNIAASCFAAGSDKTGTVDIDEVVYIDGFIDAIGLNPILNEHEYDFNNDYKWYFNFGDCDGDGSEFEYDRAETYADRMLEFYVLDGQLYPDWEMKMSVLDYMESRGLFTYQWGAVPNTMVSGFALAVDDAVQVLDAVHGDSNIRFAP
jgi:hypothetical protein